MNEVNRQVEPSHCVRSLALAAALSAGIVASACTRSTAAPQTPVASTAATEPSITYAATRRSTPPSAEVANPKLTVVAGLTPAEAANLIARVVTQSRPLLFPEAVPNTWNVEVSNFFDANGFTARFTSPDGAKSILLALVVANPSEPGPSTVHSEPNFHGDARSIYQVQDKNDPASFRWLLWDEPGVWGEEPARTTAPYYLSATGLTDTEFWQVANSLRLIQQ